MAPRHKSANRCPPTILVTIGILSIITLAFIVFNGSSMLSRFMLSADAIEMMAFAPDKLAQENMTGSADSDNNSERAREPQVWLEPHDSRDETIIIVLSARGHFEQRTAIRDSWAKNTSNVYFIIGDECPYPPDQRTHELTCESDPYLEAIDTAYKQQLYDESTGINEEQRTFRDLIWTQQPENYRGLPHKVKEAYAWIVATLPTAKWIVKVDDDMYVRVERLGAYLQTQNVSSTHYVVLGHIRSTSRPNKKGKWVESNYKKPFYPNFPQGSYGHAVSRSVAEYIGTKKDTLFDYQGEDVSIGIWLDESPHKEQTKWVESTQFTRIGSVTGKLRTCGDIDFVVMGHDITPKTLQACYENDKHTLPVQKGNMSDPWIPPKVTNDTMVVIVMSGRGNFQARKTIRETWGMGHDNVYFAINMPCPVPLQSRTGLYKLVCEGIPGGEDYLASLSTEQENLVNEQAKFHDIIYIKRPESYHALVHKLKAAYEWVVQNTKADWVLKADDDTFVRVSSVGTFLARYSPTNPTVVGRIIHSSAVQQQGKWADPDYPERKYPPWPQGSCGHIVSRPVAEYVARNIDTLHEYQGEDASLGIWLNESPIKSTVIWVNSPAFINEGKCIDPKFLVVGHSLSDPKMRECYTAGDETMVDVYHPLPVG